MHMKEDENTEKIQTFYRKKTGTEVPEPSLGKISDVQLDR